jgi:hypothetical protein
MPEAAETLNNLQATKKPSGGLDTISKYVNA